MLSNLVVNLRATGVAAVLIVLVICMTALGLKGESGLADLALGSFIALGAILTVSLTQSPHEPSEKEREGRPQKD